MIPQDANMKLLAMLDEIQKGVKPTRTVGAGSSKNIEVGEKGIQINTSTPTKFTDMRRDETGEISHQGISSDQYNLMIFADSPTDMQFIPSSMVSPLPERIPWLPPSMFVKGFALVAKIVELGAKLGLM